MNTTTYDEGTKIASIQPGSDWERVFSTLDPYGVAAVGGRASVVGVGGFITGGGVSEPNLASHRLSLSSMSQTFTDTRGLSTPSIPTLMALLATRSPTSRLSLVMVLL